jgi:hypothetical protein
MESAVFQELALVKVEATEWNRPRLSASRDWESAYLSSAALGWWAR